MNAESLMIFNYGDFCWRQSRFCDRSGKLHQAGDDSGRRESNLEDESFIDLRKIFRSKAGTMEDTSGKIVEMPKKTSLSSKVCKVCGDVIERTRRAARDWEKIHYCSAACRRTGVAHKRMATAS